MPSDIDDLRRLLAFAEVCDVSGCWLWTGAVNAKGYGRVWCRGRNALAHRAVLELVRGEAIPPEAHVHHVCACTSCVNPAHLRVVSLEENVAEAWERRRGGDGGGAVASAADVPF